jgi:hypothetical protein
LSFSFVKTKSNAHSNDWMDAMASEVSAAGAQQDLRRKVAELERDLDEAHQREAATAELLQVINRPQFALQSIFDSIAQFKRFHIQQAIEAKAFRAHQPESGNGLLHDTSVTVSSFPPFPCH